MWDEFVAPQRKTLDMGNYTMHYIDIGQGEPVVMVHGMMLSAYSWRKNVPALLEAGFRVILIDVPGHGRTEIPDEPYRYTVEQIASDIVTLTHRLGLNQFNLIGHSLGAGLTLYMSIHYPQRLRKGVVVDPPAFGPPRRLLLTYPGMTSLASVCFGRWTVKASMKAMYHDDSLVSESLVDEYTRPTQKDGFWNMYSALSHQYFSHEFLRCRAGIVQ
ncbi:alpha/beta fold hydrolase [Thermodesulfobacteriota bacterium]